MKTFAVLLCAAAVLFAAVSSPREAQALNSCNPQVSKC
jgi:hypothetical protein